MSSPERYRHTQIGYLILFSLFAVSLMFGAILIEAKTNLPPVIYIEMVLILLILISFVPLTVTIDGEYLRIKFGYGIYRKRFLLSEITSVKTVKNHWYYGWGIRIWFWPYMVIYNVSGFDAVEIYLKNRKRFRIGTDEPKKLERAVSQAIK